MKAIRRCNVRFDLVEGTRIHKFTIAGKTGSDEAEEWVKLINKCK